MPNIIMADSKSGEAPIGAYVKIHQKVCVIEENNGVTNTENYQTYLMTLSGLPGDFIAFTALDPIVNPVINEIACASMSGFISTGPRCYRYRDSEWKMTIWNNSDYDAVAVPGREIIVYTKQIVVPT